MVSPTAPETENKNQWAGQSGVSGCGLGLVQCSVTVFVSMFPWLLPTMQNKFLNVQARFYAHGIGNRPRYVYMCMDHAWTTCVVRMLVCVLIGWMGVLGEWLNGSGLEGLTCTCVEWNLIITATYGPNICGCCIEAAALQRYTCTRIESHHLGLEWGGCLIKWPLYWGSTIHL